MEGFFRGIQNDGGAREFLSQHRWPPGLQEAFIQNLTKTPIRFFVCDDSGSMATSDGHRIIENHGKFQMAPCTRWTELGDAMKFHVGLAQAGCIPTEFRMLNSSAPIRIGFSPDEPLEAKQNMLALFENYPGGGTPLCRHIREIASQISSYTPALLSRGQRACVIIATDGESSDGDIAEALRPLKDLPCWVVVRLCTNEDRISDYWNGIDAQLEVQMDVLDDLSGEGGEIFKVNPWLTYCDILHRMREFGISLKEFDTLDEAALPLEMFRKVCAVIYGKADIDRLPLPEVDLPGFCEGLNQLNTRPQFQVWSPVHKKMLPFVDVKRVARQYGAHKSSCVIV
jgi:hypothetical protein